MSAEPEIGPAGAADREPPAEAPAAPEQVEQVEQAEQAAPSAPPAESDRTSPRRTLRARWSAAAALAVAAITVAAVTVGGGGSGSPTDDAGADGKSGAAAAADGPARTAVNVSPTACGQGWTGPHPGTQVFDLHNSAGSATEVYLIDPKSGRIFGEVEGLAPGTTRPMTVDLGSGTYAFKCLQEDTDAVTGPSVTVPGTVAQGASALPVTEQDLIPPTLDYQKWIGDRIAQLADGTAALKADIDGGDLTAARRDWLTAHLVYERMGAAYDTFGDADGAINGTAPIGQDVAQDPDFTGFHRIEYGLWHGQSAASLRAPAAQLDSEVRALRADWPSQRMDPAAMGLRAHEIIENAEQFELTGRTDYGSGTNLATASANIDGTRKILAELGPLLAPRDPDLAGLNTALDRAQADLDAQDQGGRWTPLPALTRAERERINADFGDLLERLAPVAAIFDVRRTA